MIPLKQKETASQNRLLCISIFFAISFSANADKNNDAEYHYRIANMAYESNQCDIAIGHFKKYLAIAEEVEQTQKTSIESAIGWCEDNEHIFEVRMIVTSGDIEIEDDSEEQARKKKELLKSKPVFITTP